MFLPLITTRLKKSDKLFLLLFCLTFVWTGIFLWLGFSKFYGFFTGFQDLGIYDQTLWNSLKGNWFHTSLQFLPGHNLLAQHGELAIIFLVPFYAIFADPKMLIFLQISGIFASSIPLYLLSRQLLVSRGHSFIISLAFLLYAPIQWAALFEFNTLPLVIPFLLWGVYFLYRRKHGWYILFLILALSTKEIVSLALFIFGLFLYFKEKQKKAGIITITLSLVWGITVFFLLIPALNTSGKHPLLTYFSDSPASYASVFGKTASIINKDNLRFTVQLLAPLAFLPLLSPILMLTVIPQFFLHFLAVKPEMKLINFHYSSIFAVFFFLALINVFKKYRTHKKVTRLMIILLVVSSLITNYTYSPSPLSRHFEKPPYLSPEVSHRISGELTKIPHDKSVSTTQRLGSHLSQRENIYIYPDGLDKADYIVLDTINFPPHPWLIAVYQEDRKQVMETIRALKQNIHYEQKIDDNQIFVFAKREEKGDNKR